MVINGRFERCCRYDVAIEYSLSAANGSSSSMSRILDSMSQSTVVSSPPVTHQQSSRNSEKAPSGHVTVTLSHGLKQVMTSLLLLSFANQLLRKEGITIPKLESSKYWMVMPNGNSEFIIATHSEANWKIDVWKTGGLSYFSPASTSLDMTQPADNINFITTRHTSTTVIRYNDVVHYAADMQTQSTVRDDKVQANASQHNTIVINDLINDEKNLPTLYVSKPLCRMQPRSRDFVTFNGYHEEPSSHFVYTKDASKPADTTHSKKEWRTNEQDGKSDPKKPRSANIASKGKDPASLVTQVMLIDDSPDPDREVSIAIVTKQPAVFNYRMLSAMNNATVLGHLCKEPDFRSRQMCYGKELGIQLSLGTSKFRSMRIAEPFQHQEPLQSKTTSDQLSSCLAVETLVSMSSIGGQQMVVSVPDDAGRIKHCNVEEMANRNTVYYHTVTPIRSKEERERPKHEYDSRPSPPPPACPVAWSATNRSQLLTPPMASRSPICTFSPSAPQVENIVDSTDSSSSPCDGLTLRYVDNDIVEHTARPRTRSIARVEGLDISDSKEDEVPKLATTTKSRAPRSSAARKLITDSKSRREPLSALNNDSSPACRQTRNTRFQVQNIEQTSSPACMSPSESRTKSSAHLTSTLPTGGGAGTDKDSDPLTDLLDPVSSSFDSGEDGRM